MLSVRLKATRTASFLQSFTEADEIAKYAKLKESGVITQEEFETKKTTFGAIDRVDCFSSPNPLKLIYSFSK